MLRSIEQLKGYTLHATDGDIGTVDDVYIDQAHWTVRYFVVKTGNWLTGRRVLISPIAFRDADWASKKVFVDLTREQFRRGEIVGEPTVRQRPETFDPAHPRYHRYEQYLVLAERVRTRLGLAI